MLKSTSFLLKSPTIQSLLNSSECTKDICSSSSLNRWYLRYLRAPRVLNPPKNPFLYDKDWENEPYKPKAKNEYLLPLKCSKDFQSLDERCKNLFTYNFVYKRQEFEENVAEMLEKLGFQPTDDSLAAKIVRMTLELRYKKWRLKEHPRCITLKLATKCLIRARQRSLRLLRATNLSEFNRITSALKIVRYEHVDPYRLCTDDPIVQRKISFRNECYQRRIAKMTVFKAKLISSEQEFYIEKNKTLTNLLGDLTLLVDSNNPETKQKEAEHLMKQLFNEVIEERQLNSLRKPIEDRFLWYTKEGEKREQFNAEKARKLEKQQRKLRK
ncbi:unnamed protein product [Schistosoma rodhaini]|uniref:28S ribosomal protein S15, mitochondrial n=1 Tax=Schistosoma mansoni TaxID=6183 RepID=G4VLA7_SCHMA|nr:hypothetical protein Smp_074210 [Schistosoma mansoni]CAH8619798.1 unnamed protein product [Schistosoma rodhaini]|eukprot:XP_018652861.1 hypothetical protein Smp_074210 [Schistosoma mansoni]